MQASIDYGVVLRIGKLLMTLQFSKKVVRVLLRNTARQLNKSDLQRFRNDYQRCNSQPFRQ